MAKRNFTRRASGLVVTDDSLAVPRVELPKPWWAGKLNPARGMGRRRCCCGSSHECTLCTSGTVFDSYALTFDGITDGTCITCGDFNTTFVVDYCGVVGSTCYWIYDFASQQCVGGYWVDRLALLFGTDIGAKNITAMFGMKSGSCGLYRLFGFGLDLSYPTDCEFSGGVLLTDKITPISSVCGIEAATCVLESL